MKKYTEEVEAILKELTLEVGRKLRSDSLFAKNVSIWIKYSNFIKGSKQMKLDNSIHTDDDIYRLACNLFDKLWDQDNYIRGLCVGVGGFSSNNDSCCSLLLEKSDNLTPINLIGSCFQFLSNNSTINLYILSPLLLGVSNFV